MSGSGVQKRVLRVGIDDAPPVPMQIGDPALGTFRGYEVDVLVMIAERLGCTLEYRRAWWSLITTELISGRLDLVCSAATVTEQRKAEVNFCKPHLKLKLALVAGQNTPETLNKETRFGVRCGTTAEAFLRDTLGQEPAALSESNDDLYEALLSGRLDAVIDDSPIAMYFARSIPGLSYRGAFQETTAEYAIMLAKDNDTLKREIDAVLLTLEADGALAMLRQQWFGTSASLVA